MPTLEMTTGIVTDSVFGNAGQRCLAASTIVTVGGRGKAFKPALAEAASSAW
jgi:malonate-semialdehyde dehydrogenase (acetylating) / methylmalonate-semialdehyde dehydrogenase